MKRRVWASTPWVIVCSLIIMVMSAVTYRYNQKLSFVEFGIAVLIFVSSIVVFVLFKKYITRTMDAAVRKIGRLSRSNLDRFKTPVVVVGSLGDIVWSNSRFKRQLCTGRDPVSESISPFIGAKAISEVADNEGFEVDFDGKHYYVFCNSTDEGYACFFIDNTTYSQIAKKFHETRKSVLLISFDNRDEFSNDGVEESTKVLLSLENKLQRFADENNALFKALPSDKYMIVMDKIALDKMVAEKFPILGEIHKIRFNNREATISIGVGADCETLVESEQKARKALDMALGRGGDQVAVMRDDNYEFFGGVSAGVEKMSKVRSRIIATSISRAVSEADRVFIMGHRFSDLDSVGAAVGLQPVIENALKKQCRVVINRETSMAKSLIDLVDRETPDVFVTPEEALRAVSAKTLLIVVDTHIQTVVESPELLQKCRKVVVIDHHRKAVNYISQALIFYHEPTASSACEMISELVTYLGEKYVSKLQAEALLSGIMLDTKNFVIRTGVRTFEAAAFLRKNGADTVETKQLFSSSLRTHQEKYKIVSAASVYRNCAVAIAEGSIPDVRLVAAQAADELLSVDNVSASFVIFENGGAVNISARSYGKLNVQLVMEVLGGGGHQNMAAAQLAGISTDSARLRLLDAINTVYPLTR